MHFEKGFFYWDSGEDDQVTADFRLSEFECKCDKEHEHMISRMLIINLQKFRDLLNAIAYNMGEKEEIKIRINSAYRCAEHNHIIGGAKDSKHVKGIAADLKIIGFKSINYHKAGMLARSIGYTGIGIYDTFVHVDVRDGSKLNMGFALWDNRSKK